MNSNFGELIKGLPGWQKFITAVGIPAAFASVLLWFVLSVLSADAKKHHNDTTQSLNAVNAYMYAICKQTAKTDKDSRFCDDVLLKLLLKSQNDSSQNSK